MSLDPELEKRMYAPPEIPEDDETNELEGALLSLCLFGGLLLFGLGCMIFGWG